MMSDTSEDLRIGAGNPQADRPSCIAGCATRCAGCWAAWPASTEAERVPVAEMPELERWVLHRLTELDARIRAAVAQLRLDRRVSGAAQLLRRPTCRRSISTSARTRSTATGPDSLRRRAARTVLDHLHRCLTTWLAPVLCFTAEEAWGARFGDAESVHLQLFPDLPRGLARRRAGGEMGDDPRHPPPHHRADRGGARAPRRSAPRWQAAVDPAARARRGGIAVAGGMGGDRHRLRGAPGGRQRRRPRRRSRRRPAPNASAAGACCPRSAQQRRTRRCACAAPTRWSPAWCAGRGVMATRVQASRLPLPLREGVGGGVRAPRSRYAPLPQPPPSRGGGGFSACIDSILRRMTRNRLTVLGLLAGAGRARRRPGEQILGAARHRPAGDRPDRAAAGAEPDLRAEQRRHLRPAERLRHLELPRAGRRWRWRWWRRSACGCAAPSRRWWRCRSAPSPAARSAT